MRMTQRIHKILGSEHVLSNITLITTEKDTFSSIIKYVAYLIKSNTDKIVVGMDRRFLEHLCIIADAFKYRTLGQPKRLSGCR